MVVGTSLKKISETTMSHKKWKTEYQINFLRQLSELLEEGFPIIDCLQFLCFTNTKLSEDILSISTQLERGSSFVDVIKQKGFDKRTLTQLQLAELNGNFEETLKYCAEYIQTIHNQRIKMRKVAVYPLFLTVMAVAMLLVVRKFMLPTLKTLGDTTSKVTEVVIWYLEHLPEITVIILFLALIIIWVLNIIWKKDSIWKRISQMAKMPVIGNFVRFYYSYYFSREFSCFLENGLSVNQMIKIMKELDTDALMVQVAEKMEEALLAGETFPSFIANTPFFHSEMSWIIHHGEITSQVSRKLKYYGQHCFSELMERIEKIIQLIQPIMFLGIGLLVVLIYLTLMLPMLNMMKGVY